MDKTDLPIHIGFHTPHTPKFTHASYTDEELMQAILDITANYISKIKIWAAIYTRLYFETQKNLYKIGIEGAEGREIIRYINSLFEGKVNIVRKENKKKIGYKPISWAELIHEVRQRVETHQKDDLELMGDCRINMATYLYRFGMGKAKATREQIATLFRLVEQTVSNDESIVHILETEKDTYELDTPRGINKLATHIVELHLRGLLRSDTALKTLELLEKKIMFSETEHVLPNFDRMKREIKPL